MVKKAKKVTKRGVKPDTKRGKYKVVKRKRKSPELTITAISGNSFKVGDKITLEDYTKNFMAATEPPKYSPAPILTLCGQLEDAILLLENRISNAIAKINSLM